MRLLLGLVASLMLTASLSSCNKDDDDSSNVWDHYTEWREANDKFFEDQKYTIAPDGQNYYQTLTPPWNTGVSILIRYLNDRSKTVGNLSPLLNSTVDVKYIGHLYDGVAFDSSYTQTAWGDSIFRTSVNTLIDGWTIALQDMRCGDSAQIIIPYTLAYGAQSSGKVKPYSTLIFNVKLVDIPFYEVRP